MNQMLQLDLSLLLPSVPDARDACVRRLIESLHSQGGVEQVHIRSAEAGGAAELCIHYDPAVLPLVRIRQLAETHGAEITAKFGHLLWKVDGIPTS